MKQPFDLAQALRRHVQPRGSAPAAATPGRTPSRAARFSTRPGARRRSRRRSSRRRIAARRRGSCARPGRRAPFSASSSRITSASGATPPIAASSSVTRTAPPPRLSAPRDRARSTSTRRINRADIARKCVRFCQSICWTSTRRRNASLTNSVACTLWFARSPQQAPAGDAPQLVVDERHQRLQSPLVSLAPGSEENRHLVGRTQNARILTGFRVVSVSAVRFPPLGMEGDMSKRITGPAASSTSHLSLPTSGCVCQQPARPHHQ